MLATEDLISKTKIILPKRRLDLLTRQRLLEILYERLDRKLIIISAAPGYGKTSLLIDLAYHSELPFCWLSLDPLDRDPQRFIAGLIASVRERFRNFGKRSQSLLKGMTSLDDGMERVLVSLINEIYDDIHEHFVLVLDDFHVLDETKPILYFVNRFIQLVGENCHVVLASRTLPELQAIPLLVAREEVGGLDFSDLSFQPDEIQALLAQNRQMRLSDEEAKRLVDLTEGWITGLQFADLGPRAARSGAQAFRTSQRVGVTVFDYLGQQVLEQQPEDLQTFLLRSSLLDEFDVGLCETVLGPLYAQPPDWPGLIGSITQKNLFTQLVGPNGQWVRYHHLFRDFLQLRLKKTQPERIPLLHRAACEWLAGKDFLRFQNRRRQARLRHTLRRASLPRDRRPQRQRNRLFQLRQRRDPLRYAAPPDRQYRSQARLLRHSRSERGSRCRRRRRRRRAEWIWRPPSFRDSPNVGAALRELAVERLVAAIEMVDAVDGGFAFGNQRGEHEADRGAQVGRHHFCTAQLLDAAHQGGRPLQRDIGAKSAELGHMHEAAFEHRLADGCGAGRDGHQGHELRLQVGGKAGIRFGSHVNGLQGAGADHHQAAVRGPDLDARAFECGAD